jgi:hypothetical protein
MHVEILLKTRNFIVKDNMNEKYEIIFTMRGPHLNNPKGHLGDFS